MRLYQKNARTETKKTVPHGEHPTFTLLIFETWQIIFYITT